MMRIEFVPVAHRHSPSGSALPGGRCASCPEAGPAVVETESVFEEMAEWLCQRHVAPAGAIHGINCLCVEEE